LKAAGVQAVIAKSFARIFFRNAINQGLPAVECSQAVDHLEKGVEVEIDFAEGKVKTRTEVFTFSPPPEPVLRIFEAGGLIAYTKKRLEETVGIPGKCEE
jgi:3-isopropylmalate/(R)-2-methylmalate dehydratase small subunit